MKSRLIEMAGQRFGRLVVLQRSTQKRSDGKVWWLTRCDCGKLHEVGASHLRRGNTQSCGCLGRERFIQAGKDNRKHGHGSVGKVSPTYSSWLSMGKRCNDPCHVHYARYGGAGVTICERWQDFRNFLADMGERPAGKTLDRHPEKDGNYEPNNCRWATKHEQAVNRKSTIWVEIGGERKCLKDWCKVFNINYRTVGSRIRSGLSMTVALSQPTKERHATQNHR